MPDRTEEVVGLRTMASQTPKITQVIAASPDST
jgi:hypothetical protein